MDFELLFGMQFPEIRWHAHCGDGLGCVAQVCRHDWKNQSRGMLGIVVDRVGGRHGFDAVRSAVSSVQVLVEAGKVTAGDLELDAVTGARPPGCTSTSLSVKSVLGRRRSDLVRCCRR